MKNENEIEKSAILKGQTLINLSGHDRVTGVYSTYVDGVYKYLKDVNQYYDTLIINDNTISMFLPSKTYTFIIDSKLLVSEVNGYTNPPRTHGVIILFEDGTYQTPMTSWVNVGERIEQKIKFTIENKPIKKVEIRLFTTGLSTLGKFNGEVYKVMLVEGDYANQDIPYFEGMQSVQMPVLCTTGKNLFDMNKAIDAYLDSSGGIVTLADAYNKLSDYIEIKPNTTYYYSHGGFTIPEDCKLKTLWTRYYTYDENKTKLSYGTQTLESFSLTTPTNAKYVRIGSRFIGLEDAYAQLEEGTVATTYEPYKSNILTVNEDVELRKVSNIQDELDVLTGKLTQRIGEIVLDGSENWELGTTKENTQVFYYNSKTSIKDYNAAICDKFRFNVAEDDVEKIVMDKTGQIYIAVEKTKYESVSKFKTWLSNNNIFIQYRLATESIKTVDLTIQDQDNQPQERMKLFPNGYINTSSSTYPPILELKGITHNNKLNMATTNGTNNTQ